MTESPGSSRWSFACLDIGLPCEWRLRAATQDEVELRFREHAKCAHGASDATGELIGRVRGAARSV
ncbi:MAG: DUF1059 domain-containing protein [Thermoplasmata archaeon]